MNKSLAQEIKDMANQYRKQKKVEKSKTGADDNFDLDNFLPEDLMDGVFGEDFDPKKLHALEDEMGDISAYLKGVRKSKDFGVELLEKSDKNPRNEAMHLLNNVQKNLRELKMLVRN